MEQNPKVIRRLTWVHVRGWDMLFIKNDKRDVLFEPGVRWIPGNTKTHADEVRTSDEEFQRQKTLLQKKIERDLRVSLISPVRFRGSFKAQAYGEEEGVMVEMRIFTSDYLGFILDTPSPGLRALWVSYKDKAKHNFSPATIRMYEWLRRQGIY